MKRVRAIAGSPYTVTLVIVLLLGLSLYRSAVFRICESRQTYEADNQRSEKPEKLPDFGDCVEEAIDQSHDLILAVGTALIAWFTATLWLATIRSSEHFRATERAYVKMTHHSPPGIDFVPAESGDFFINIMMIFKNSGRSPARVTDNHLQHEVRPNNEMLAPEPKYNFPQRPRVAAFLVTNDVFNFSGTFGSLSPTEKAGVDNGKLRLWIYGYVDYIDVFGQKHRGGYGRMYSRLPQTAENNLIFDGVPAGYNYDRPRVKGEGRDWND